MNGSILVDLGLGLSFRVNASYLGLGDLGESKLASERSRTIGENMRSNTSYGG